MSLEIRECDFTNADDVRVFMEHRTQVYLLGGNDATAVEKSGAMFVEWMRSLEDGMCYRHWFVVRRTVSESRIVGGAGVWLLSWLPHPTELTGRRGKVMHVFTEPQFRRQGVGTLVLRHIVAFARDQVSGTQTHLKLNLDSPQTKLKLNLLVLSSRCLRWVNGV